MFSFHRRLFDFDHWANGVVLDAVEPVSASVPKAIDRLNHILGASRVWLGRITNEPAPFGLEATFGVTDLRREFESARADWNRYFATRNESDLSRVITYGNALQIAVSDILTHIPLHGQQHRGQVNVDLRAAGLTPPSIDYVHAVRRGLF